MSHPGDPTLDAELLEILGNMRVAVFRAAPDSSLLALNEAGAQLLGASAPAELIGRRFADFYADPAEREEARRLLAEHGRVIGFRFRVRRLDGSLTWMETNFLARSDEEGRLLSIEGFGREVSELVAAEAQVRKLDKFLKIMIDAVDVLIVGTDADGKVLIWNPTSEAVTGYPRQEVLGRAEVWEWLYPDPEYRRRKIGHARRLMVAVGRHEDESVIRTKGGEDRIISWNASSVVDAQGEVIGLAIGRDVTLERQQESRRRSELEALVRERTAELEKANRELKLLDEMKARFLANISHELRTPLVSGLGYVNLVLDGGMDEVGPKARKGLRISQQNLQRLASLIDDLLAFTQHGAGARPLQPQPFELGRLVQECILDMQGGSPAPRITADLEPALPSVMADREQIRRVLSNLLTNAEKFSGADAHIEVQARPLGPDRIEVRVCDNGIGIPADERELVFERLYRSTRTDPNVHRGTGIGLYLVREILKAHGCSVRAEGRDGPGTAIVFTLPVAA